MEDVEIEDVDDDSPLRVQRDPLKNQDLSSFTDIAGQVLSLYGWHLLLAFTLFLLIQYLNKRRSAQSESSTASAATQDAVFVAQRQEAMEAARRKMQDDLDAKAVIFREKQKQREEEKRRLKLENYKGIVPLDEAASTSSASMNRKTDKKTLRSTDYSPLSGQGGGTCSWRPGRRGPSSGG